MDMLQPPTATAFDAFAGIVSATLYLIVGIAVLVHTPRDRRARVFFTIAVASVAPYLMPAAIWRFGSSVGLSAWAIVAVAVSLAVGAVALFHFMQVFPAERPWIAAHGRWIAAAYTILPLAAAATGWLVARLMTSARVSSGPYLADAYVPLDVVSVLGLLAIGIPTLVVVTLVLPMAGLLSLYKSWLEAAGDNRKGARVITFWILVSQLAGGVLTILIVPLLHVVTSQGPWVTIASALLFGFGLLMPIAFAIGVWKYRLLGQA
jgi:hypothetical protein